MSFGSSGSLRRPDEPGKFKENKKYTLIEYKEEIKAGRRGYVEFLVLAPERNLNRR